METPQQTHEDHLCLALTLGEAKELQYIFDRGTNTLDPQKWSPFMKQLEQAVSNFITKHTL